MIGKPALQSKPKKKATEEERKHPFTSNHHPTRFVLSPGERLLKVLCHGNHIGKLKTTLCGTPDALTVYYHPLTSQKVHYHMIWQRTVRVPLRTLSSLSFSQTSVLRFMKIHPNMQTSNFSCEAFWVFFCSSSSSPNSSISCTTVSPTISPTISPTVPSVQRVVSHYPPVDPVGPTVPSVLRSHRSYHPGPLSKSFPPHPCSLTQRRHCPPCFHLREDKSSSDRTESSRSPLRTHR